MVTPQRNSGLDSEEGVKEEVAAVEKAATQEEFRVNVLLRLLS